MKVVFLEPASPDLHVYKRMALPRMGCLYLATILKQAGHEVRVYAENIKPPEPKVLCEADVVAISTITATTPRAYEYARMLRSIGVKTIIGGPHVTFMHEEALEHADVVAIGEAENSIVPLIDALDGKLDLSEVPGIAYKEDGEIRKTPPAPPIMDLDELPTVDFSLLEGGLPRVFVNTVIPVMTSRGCPYNCNFCSVTAMFGRKYRFRSPAKVIEDLKSIPNISKHHVFFYDDHFTARREHTWELMERIIKEGFRFSFSAQVRVELGKDAELLALMKKAGMDMVYVGLESAHPETLKSYNKGQTVEDMEVAIKAFHRSGIHIHGMFVFGSDEDTVETLRETTRFAKRNHIESVQFLVLTPIPGTRFYKQLEEEGRLATNYWTLFDGHYVTFEPKRMTPYELQYETFRGMRDFYSLWDCTKPLLKFRFVEATIRFYGRNMVKTWTRTHRHYLDDFRASWRNALSAIEAEWRQRLATAETASAAEPSLPPLYQHD